MATQPALRAAHITPTDVSGDKSAVLIYPIQNTRLVYEKWSKAKNRATAKVNQSGFSFHSLAEPNKQGFAVDLKKD